MSEVVPVYRALLPRAAQLLPYLERVDANRWYTNRGELVTLLETRLSERFPQANVMSAATGTVAIEAAILASAGRATADRPLAILPSYTFVATAMAAEACGYRPYFVDVELQTWSLASAMLAGHPALARAGVVVPVAPYGRPIAQAEWIAFQRHTDIPVVIDGAASFEALLAEPERTTGEIPVTLSFQSTKAFSSGEGGAVVWSDDDGLKRIAQALNFGFLYKRESTSAGTNGKMSEYHAAVGLAALDAWAATCTANSGIAERYRAAAQTHGIGERLFIAPTVASNYAIVDAGSSVLADALIEALKRDGIESRRWYGRGVHTEPYWTDAERDRLPITERLAPALLGLPIAPDLEAHDVERIVATTARAIGSSIASHAS